MKTIRLQEVPAEERSSPKGLYHLFQKNLSLVLGGKKDAGPAAGGHPFDVAWVSVPVGCKNWPVHRHSAQWEFYFVLAGNGRYFDGTEWNEIRAGQAVLTAPGEEHQIENRGTGDLVYLVIADMPVADVIAYPATGLAFVKPERQFVRPTSVNYYDGHE